MDNKTIKVLLIEQDPTDIQALQHMLSAAKAPPFELALADCLSDGLEQLAKEAFDVVLLALLLPDSQGLDTFLKVRAQAPQVPTIVLSSLHDEAVAVQAVAEGAQDQLVKEQTSQDLLTRAIRYAVHRRQNEEALQRRNRELAALNRAGHALSSNLDLDQVLTTLLEETRRLMGVVATSVWLIDPQTGEIVCRQVTGPHSEVVRGWRLASGEGIAGWTVESRQSQVVPDARTEEHHFAEVDRRTGLPLRSIISTPLWRKQQVIGVLQVVDTEVGRFDVKDLALLEPLAASAAIAIENAQLYEETDKLRAFNQTIVQSLEEGIILEDVAGGITFANPKAAELLEYTPEELVGRHWADIVAPGHQADIETAITGQTKDAVIRYETVLLTRGGQEMPAIVSARWLYEEGRLTSVLSAFTDITARRHAEAAVRESEEKYRTLFESSPESITLLSPDGIILDCNDATAEIIGLTREEIISKPFTEISMLEDVSSHLKILSRLMSGEKVAPYGVQIARHDGKTRWVEAFPVALKKDSEIYALQVVTRDVTKRKVAEDKIRLRNEELTLINGITAAVSQSLDLQDILEAALAETTLALNTQGGMIHLLNEANQSFTLTAHCGLSPGILEIFGQFKSGEGLLGRTAQTSQPLFMPDLTADPKASIPAAIKEEWRSLVSIPLEAKGQVSGVMTILGQQTGQFAAERLSMLTVVGNQIGVAVENARLFEEVRTGRERLQALSRRLVDVQENERRYIARELHDEIGQALTGLKLMLDMAVNAPGEDAKERLREALAAVNELLTRARDLSLDLRPSMLDDLGLLPALLWHCGRYTTQTNVRVDLRHTNLEGRRFKPEVETAAYRIVQEALTNVARHTNVDVATVRLWVEWNMLGIQVEDKGPGFDPEDPAIADVSSGLNGMRERAALLAGRLTIDSAPGMGTRLTAELPLGDPAENSPGQ